MEHFNKLTPAEAERLAWLLEELGECQQAIGKILRHGYNSKDPTNPNHLGNRADLERELTDVAFSLLLMDYNKDIDLLQIYNDASLKFSYKQLRYMHHNNKD